MKAISYLKVTAYMLTVASVVGCGSPTKKFESFVAKAEGALRADAALKKDHIFSPVKYDVKQTDSTVSPFGAQVVVAGVNVPALVEKQLRIQGGDQDAAVMVVQHKLEVDEPKAKQLVQEAQKRMGPKTSFGDTPEGRKFENAVEATSDDGTRTYRFMYAYQDGKWVLKDSQIDTVNQQLMLGGVPKAIKQYFTP